MCFVSSFVFNALAFKSVDLFSVSLALFGSVRQEQTRREVCCAGREMPELKSQGFGSAQIARHWGDLSGVGSFLPKNRLHKTSCPSKKPSYFPTAKILFNTYRRCTYFDLPPGPKEKIYCVDGETLSLRRLRAASSGWRCGLMRKLALRKPSSQHLTPTPRQLSVRYS